MKEFELLDINLPSQVAWYSFSPLTLFLAGFVVILFVIFVSWFFMIRKKTKKYLVFEEIFKEMNQLESAIKKNQLSCHQVAISVEKLIKRVAMTFFDQDSLRKINNNDAWFDYLNQQVKKNVLDESVKDIFIKAPYQPDISFNVDKYLQDIKNYFHSLKKNV